MSTIMEMMNYFHDYMMTILILIMTFVSYLFLSILFTKRIDKVTMDSHLLETIWTVIPMIILLFMAFPSLYLLYLMEDISNPTVTVKVIGHQWYWEYQYSNAWMSTTFDSFMVHKSEKNALFYNLDVDNRLILPILAHVLFLVTSVDVIHAWTIPSLGIKTDAIPGRLNYLTTIVPFSGVFYGQCSEICGSNHSFMPIVVEFLWPSYYTHMNL